MIYEGRVPQGGVEEGVVLNETGDAIVGHKVLQRCERCQVACETVEAVHAEDETMLHVDASSGKIAKV